MIVTGSCLESISLCLRAVTQPGDVVALESPTYFGFLLILESLNLRALEIPRNRRTGLSLDALQLAFDTQPVKAVLAVPTLSNPVGASLPLAERERPAQMVAAHGIPLIEDVLYNNLAEQDDKRRAVRSFPKGTRVTDPAGGYILWVELPAAIDSLALFHACLAERICIAPGTMFSATGRYRNCVRLGVGGRWSEAHRAGLRRVGAIARAMLEAVPLALAPALQVPAAVL